MLEKSKKVVYMGSDHAGFEMKNALKEYLKSTYNVIDLGVFKNASFDYPDIAREVGEKVLERRKTKTKGILVCGSGTGMAIAASKLKGIRAANCNTVELAEMARKHNDANIVAIGGRMVSLQLAKKIVDKFLTTDFEKTESRHLRRVKKMEANHDLKK